MTNREIIYEDITEDFDSQGIIKDDIIYFARIIPNCGLYEVQELIARTVMPTYFVGTDTKTRQAFLFGYNNINKIVFKDRKDALEAVKAAEKNHKKVSDEKYYEEY